MSIISFNDFARSRMINEGMGSRTVLNLLGDHVSVEATDLSRDGVDVFPKGYNTTVTTGDVCGTYPYIIQGTPRKTSFCGKKGYYFPTILGVFSKQTAVNAPEILGMRVFKGIKDSVEFSYASKEAPYDVKADVLEVMNSRYVDGVDKVIMVLNVLWMRCNFDVETMWGVMGDILDDIHDLIKGYSFKDVVLAWMDVMFAPFFGECVMPNLPHWWESDFRVYDGKSLVDNGFVADKEVYDIITRFAGHLAKIAR